MVILIRVFGGRFTDIIQRRKIALPALFMIVVSMPIAFFVSSYSQLILFSLVFAVKSFERAGRGFPQRNGTYYNLRCSSKPQRFTV